MRPNILVLKRPDVEVPEVHGERVHHGGIHAGVPIRAQHIQPVRERKQRDHENGHEPQHVKQHLADHVDNGTDLVCTTTTTHTRHERLVSAAITRASG